MFYLISKIISQSTYNDKIYIKAVLANVIQSEWRDLKSLGNECSGLELKEANIIPNVDTNTWIGFDYFTES